MPLYGRELIFEYRTTENGPKLYTLQSTRWSILLYIQYTHKRERVYYIVFPSQDEERNLLNLLMRLLSPIYYNIILYTIVSRNGVQNAQ